MAKKIQKDFDEGIFGDGLDNFARMNHHNIKPKNPEKPKTKIKKSISRKICDFIFGNPESEDGTIATH